MALMVKDETIKKWISSYGSKTALEEEMRRRLAVLDKEYDAKKERILTILTRLKKL